MTQRQIIHSVDLDTFAWLKALADADNVGVGEIVRRCIHFARESQGEPAEATQEELQAEWERAQALKRDNERRAMIAAKQAELEALMRGDPIELGPAQVEQRGETSVLDMDFSNEPRAEDVEIPPDPDDAPAPRAVTSRPVSDAPVGRAYGVARPMASLLDTTSLTPPSGQRPGTATRPAPPRSEQAFGLKMGDATGNVVRANFAHLGFSRGGV